MSMKQFSVGESDFKNIITGNYYYVDKSLFIKEVIDRGNRVILVPRPRRFGKTLNISMLKYFYDCCPEKLPLTTGTPHPGTKPVTPGNSYKDLFTSLAIADAGPQYLEKMGQHPVIFLTFKDIKESNWKTCWSKIKELIQDEYVKHDYLLDSPVIKPTEKKYFKKIIDLEGDEGNYENSLGKLLVFLYRYYGKKVVILIDEYDAPVHAGFNNQYYKKIINFTRNFLCGGLKDTGQYLEKGVITGIMCIAQESIFSGLNNPGVFTLLSEEFNDKFGFTGEEVEKMLIDFDVRGRYEGIQQWYNGYNFGGRIIYNPWSITNFLDSKAKELKPYWINTSDNEIVETLLSKEGKELKIELEQLLRGESIEKVIDENIVLRDIYLRDNLLWSFLLMGGYLKQTGKRPDNEGERIYYRLTIPNKEVRVTYKTIVENYFSSKIENRQLEIMLKGLVEGDIVLFEEMLQKVVAAVFSYHDLSGEPEKVYHALVAGMLTWISNTHEIKSNRESGYGRYDIIIIPADVSQWGYIIEFKKVRKDETVDTGVKSALKQIEEKKYETELLERGIKHIKKLAIAFNGKEVFVKEHGALPQ
ncbi:MAG: ATP-binding protein [Acidobacteria bacterium]|nr:ATP-binding protein [Acidobacteriota bacterium]